MKAEEPAPMTVTMKKKKKKKKKRVPTFKEQEIVSPRGNVSTPNDGGVKTLKKKRKVVAHKCASEEVHPRHLSPKPIPSSTSRVTPTMHRWAFIGGGRGTRGFGRFNRHFQ